MKNKKTETKHPLLIQEDKLELMEEALVKLLPHKQRIKRLQYEVEKLRHRVILDSIKAAINLNYTHTEELKAVFTTLNMSNETLQEQKTEL